MYSYIYINIRNNYKADFQEFLNLIIFTIFQHLFIKGLC